MAPLPVEQVQGHRGATIDHKARQGMMPGQAQQPQPAVHAQLPRIGVAIQNAAGLAPTPGKPYG